MSDGKPLPLLLIGIFGLFVLAMAGAFVSSSGAFSSNANSSPSTSNIADVSTSTPTPTPPPPPPAPAGPPSYGKLRLWAGGDSLAAFVANHLVTDAQANGAAFADEEWKVSSGLSRPDFFNWQAELQQIIDRDHPNVMVFMSGANDAQGLTTPDGSAVQVTPFSDAWTVEYTKRVNAAMDLMSADGRLGIWVGLPVMNDPAFQAEMEKLNGIFKAAASHHPRIIYMDSTPVLANNGAFSLDLPNASGTPIAVRAGDGVHLTSEGGELLAQAILHTLEGTMANGGHNP